MTTARRWERLALWVGSTSERLRLRLGRRSRRTDRILMLVATGIFGVAAYLGYRRFPGGVGDLRWVPLLVGSLGGVPFNVGLNGLEYWLMGRIIDRRVGPRAALRVSVVASAANVLPLPGAVLVRVQALSELGAGYGRATSAAALVGLWWIATTVLLAGLTQLVLASPALGLVATAAGLVGLGVGYLLLWLRKGRRHAPRTAALIIGVETAFVAVASTRMFLILWGLGFDADIAQAVALTVAGAVATALGFFPGGLGVRELLAAGIASAVGMPAAIGLVASIAVRLSSFSVLGVASLVIAVRGPKGGRGTLFREEGRTPE